MVLPTQSKTKHLREIENEENINIFGIMQFQKIQKKLYVLQHLNAVIVILKGETSKIFIGCGNK